MLEVAAMCAVSWRLRAQDCHYLLDCGKQESRPVVETMFTYFIDVNNAIRTELISEGQPLDVCILKRLKEFVLHTNSRT